jgi:hypothetical protein
LRDESLPILSAANADDSPPVAPGFALLYEDSPRSFRGEPGISQTPPSENRNPKTRAPPNSKSLFHRQFKAAEGVFVNFK